MKDLFGVSPILAMILMAGMFISLSTYLHITIAGILSYRKQKVLTPAVIVLFIIHVLFLISWLDMALCGEAEILAIGIIFPIVIFIYTKFLLKKASFCRQSFTKKHILKSLLIILFYFVSISPMVGFSVGKYMLAVDCGI